MPRPHGRVMGGGYLKDFLNSGIFAVYRHCQNTNVYHIHIWKVLSQLNCGDTRQIWMWFTLSQNTFSKSRISHKKRLVKGSFVTPPQILKMWRSSFKYDGACTMCIYTWTRSPLVQVMACRLFGVITLSKIMLNCLQLEPTSVKLG